MQRFKSIHSHKWCKAPVAKFIAGALMKIVRHGCSFWVMHKGRKTLMFHNSEGPQEHEERHAHIVVLTQMMSFAIKATKKLYKSI
ncbi:MAG: hypothetical protein A2Y53_01200 [Chloroflexi bacterium RBG_16_47_49]|nr:MAG: hypothetical protein A2Y53_01200 [Chloroflexi bacterium RBG_16_47_49]